MGVLEASPAIHALALIASGTTAYAFVCDRRAQQVARRALRRVREHRPAEFEAIPAFCRRFARPTINVRLLRTVTVTAIISDELIELKQLERRTFAAIALAIGSVGVALLGTYLFQWRWG